MNSPIKDSDFDRLGDHLEKVQSLLSRHRLVERLVNRQQMPRQDLVGNLVHQQNLTALYKLLAEFPATDVARILEALTPEDRELAWGQINPDRLDAVLMLLIDEVRTELVHLPMPERVTINAFELYNGRLRQVKVHSQEDLERCKPIWVDLVAPSPAIRSWIGEYFGIEIPDPETLTDLEASARYYVEDRHDALSATDLKAGANMSSVGFLPESDSGEVHLHSDFLLDTDEIARNVACAFILHRDILFSVRSVELPVFRLQRLRARLRPGYVRDGKDVLLDLYAADAEYSADVLEKVYADLGTVGRKVLNPHISDEEAALILAEIGRSEDLNGRIRRNVLDTRRAVSFLMRGHFLVSTQQEDARQILRDIESLDGHTGFLFGKINFLMDSTVAFININQNRRISKLTTISVIFMPVNLLAGIGGMSEFSAMSNTLQIPWPLAYSLFLVGSALIGYGTYLGLGYWERRELSHATLHHYPESNN